MSLYFKMLYKHEPHKQIYASSNTEKSHPYAELQADGERENFQSEEQTRWPEDTVKPWQVASYFYPRAFRNWGSLIFRKLKGNVKDYHSNPGHWSSYFMQKNQFENVEFFGHLCLHSDVDMMFAWLFLVDVWHRPLALREGAPASHLLIQRQPIDQWVPTIQESSQLFPTHHHRKCAGRRMHSLIST